MNTPEEDCIELEARGIPRTKINWSDDWDRHESTIMNLPPDLDLALHEMERGKVITLEEFKEEFKEWRDRIIRMSGFNMVFTKHFESQLNTVLNYHKEQRCGSTGFSSAVFEYLCWDLRDLPKSPLKNSYPTIRPEIRYLMVMDINVVFHYDKEVITVLSICT